VRGNIFSSCPNWDPPTPSPAGECVPLPLWLGGWGVIGIGSWALAASFPCTAVQCMYLFTYSAMCPFIYHPCTIFCNVPFYLSSLYSILQCALLFIILVQYFAMCPFIYHPCTVFCNVPFYLSSLYNILHLQIQNSCLFGT
jgi:hypothetical protein